MSPFILKDNNAMGNKELISKDRIQIIVYQKGEKTYLNPQSKHFLELQNECEKLIILANDRRWDPATPKNISKIKKKGFCIEIIYKVPRTFNTSFGYFETDHLLIPLSGFTYVGTKDKPWSIIYFDEPCAPNPYISKKSTEKIKMLLQLMDIEIK